jgi:hypothetical protein
MDSVSMWWLLAAFIGGGSAGMFVMALMCMAGGLPRHAQHLPNLKGQAF